MQEGLQPVFADIDPTTGNVDSASVAECLTDRTGALLLVHYGGYPCDLEELYALATGRRVAVIEDCAHACGAIYRGRRIGSHGDLRVLLSRGQEPADRRWRGAHRPIPGPAARARRLRWFGISSDTFERASGGYRWDYAVTELGFKCPMNDIHAALALAQLGHVDADNARRRIAAQYRAGLDGVPGIELLRSSRTGRAASISSARSRSGVTISWTSSPSAASTSACITGRATCIRCSPPPLPNVESFWRRAISLPMHVALTDEEVGEVIAVIREAGSRAGRFASRSRHEDARARDR